jgi:DNA-binding CsgD family transcriptional regulator/outer membrane lipoprotein-sorting protein
MSSDNGLAGAKKGGTMTQLFHERTPLSKREKEVLDLLIQGISNKQIAFHLGISEKTVEKHITSIYQKTGVRSRAEVIVWAMARKKEGRDFSHAEDRDIPHCKRQRAPLKWHQTSVKRRMPMKRKDFLVPLIVGVLLGLLAIRTGIPFMLMESPSAKASDQMNEILSLVLNSHSRWATAQGEAEIVWYGSNGETQTYINKFVIYQPLSAYIEVINKFRPGFNEGVWISDGHNTYNVDKERKSYTQGKIPRFANDLSVLPGDLSQVKDDVVYNHPFSLLIPAPVKDYIYPEWFAQGNPSTAYSLLGEDSLLGRKTWIVNLKHKTGQATAWIDQTTGMILKYVQEENGQKYVEVNFTHLEVDMPVSADIFSVAPEYHLVR